MGWQVGLSDNCDSGGDFFGGWDNIVINFGRLRSSNSQLFHHLEKRYCSSVSWIFFQISLKLYREQKKKVVMLCDNGRQPEKCAYMARINRRICNNFANIMPNNLKSPSEATVSGSDVKLGCVPVSGHAKAACYSLPSDASHFIVIIYFIVII